MSYLIQPCLSLTSFPPVLFLVPFLPAIQASLLCLEYSWHDFFSVLFSAWRSLPQIVTVLLLPLPWGLYPKVHPVTDMTVSCAKNDLQFLSGILHLMGPCRLYTCPDGLVDFASPLWIFLASQLGPRLRSSSLLLRNLLFGQSRQASVRMCVFQAFACAMSVNIPFAKASWAVQHVPPTGRGMDITSDPDCRCYLPRGVSLTSSL